MGRYKCSAHNCASGDEPDVTFFKFPLYNDRKLKKWLQSMKWKDWSPSRFSVLCSHHFEERYIDRSGRSIKLRDDAVPTIFSSAQLPQKKQVTINPRNKRNKSHRGKAAQTSSSLTSAANTNVSVDAQIQTDLTKHSEEEETKPPGRWRVIVDEGLTKIESFPSFFHGDYCLPQVVQWAPDDNLSTECPDADNVIQVTEPWEWLGLDVRGPLPQTANGHRYIFTLTDYHSKWVEASPMQACLASEVALQISEAIAHFGFPLRILSRLPHDIVHKINGELKDRLKVDVALLVHHRQTGTADLITPQLIDRMVNELMDQHAADWDVYLPAKVFGLCFTEHPKSGERPFSSLCCKDPRPVRTPRGLHLTSSKIGECAFVVR